ncbi:hypothetical protein THAOC_26805, partial [Thalassiosira oceanica]
RSGHRRGTDGRFPAHSSRAEDGGRDGGRGAGPGAPAEAEEPATGARGGRTSSTTAGGGVQSLPGGGDEGGGREEETRPPPRKPRRPPGPSRSDPMQRTSHDARETFLFSGSTERGESFPNGRRIVLGRLGDDEGSRREMEATSRKSTARRFQDSARRRFWTTETFSTDGIFTAAGNATINSKRRRESSMKRRREVDEQKLCSGARSRRSRQATGAEGGACTIFALRGRDPSRAGRPSELREVSAGRPSPIVTSSKVAVLHRGSRDGGAGRPSSQRPRERGIVLRWQHQKYVAGGWAERGEAPRPALSRSP